MGCGAQVVFTTSMASGVSVTSGVDMGHSWHQVWAKIPTMASGSDVYFLGSEDGVTYKRVFHSPTISNAAPGARYVTSAITNCYVPLPDNHMRYIQFQLSTATSDTPYTFKVLCTGEFT
jgi:hypothetical protein